jgi:hypothetical protein
MGIARRLGAFSPAFQIRLVGNRRTQVGPLRRRLPSVVGAQWELRRALAYTDQRSAVVRVPRAQALARFHLGWHSSAWPDVCHVTTSVQRGSSLRTF